MSELMVYRQFEGDYPPGQSRLARPLDVRKPNICCLVIEEEEYNGLRAQGWCKSIEAAEKKEPEKEAPEESKVEENSDNSN